MKKAAVLKYFKGPAKTARALGVTHQAVSQWGEMVPERIAWRAEKLSDGKLKLKEEVYRNGQ